jgi:hypothetical protein
MANPPFELTSYETFVEREETANHRVRDCWYKPDPENLACVKTMFTLISGSHELLVFCESLKDVILHELTDGIPVDCPCRGERRRMRHEENETVSP